LIDEGAKLNLNYANTNELKALPNMTSEFAQAILNWRNASGSIDGAVNYAAQGYTAKNAEFETVDELRLVYGATADLLAGADVNRNGILDANESDVSRNGAVASGLFEHFTVFSREPNMHSDGSAFVNVNMRASLTSLLQTTFGSARAEQILARVTSRSGRSSSTYSNPLQFYLQSGMTSSEFAKIASAITTSSAAYIYGRVNVNTASGVVLACLPGMDDGTARTLVSYRQQNPEKLASIAWVVDALGSGSTAVKTLAKGDYVTTRCYQFTADVAALGPYGRGYRRTRFVFDLSCGRVQIVYRQELSRLGWALGPTVRDTWLAKGTR
jgi:DNA uptake protein ComE-like DNA-binding protein